MSELNMSVYASGVMKDSGSSTSHTEVRGGVVPRVEAALGACMRQALGGVRRLDSGREPGVS